MHPETFPVRVHVQIYHHIKYVYERTDLTIEEAKKLLELKSKSKNPTVWTLDVFKDHIYNSFGARTHARLIILIHRQQNVQYRTVLLLSCPPESRAVCKDQPDHLQASGWATTVYNEG